MMGTPRPDPIDWPTLGRGALAAFGWLMLAIGTALAAAMVALAVMTVVAR